MTAPRLGLSRAQVLAFRRRAGALDERLPPGAPSLRRAAWAGLQDSMPRAALLSLHARVEGTEPAAWEHPSLVQLWGPRFNVFVVPECDLAVFSLGTLPDGARGWARADGLARDVATLLKGRRVLHGEIGRALGIDPNRIRYAAATGTVLIRWDGARQTTVWTVPPPEMDARQARLELARRYLHIYGPTTSEAFGRWAGTGAQPGAAAVEALQPSLAPVRTPLGDAWILADDEAECRAAARAPAPARLLPSGDPFLLSYGADRDLLVPDPHRQGVLWPSRVWPGGVLVDGDIAGTWRRADAVLTVQPWRTLTRAERDAVEAEARSLPLPGLEGPVTVRWQD